jgi:DNA repair protein RadD
MSRMRGFQTAVQAQCYDAWEEGAQVVMPVVPTGGGKTVIVGDTAREHDGYGIAVAHRSELVMQISQAFAKEGIRHDIVAPKNTIKQIVAAHMDDEEIGRSYFDARAAWKIASVDTIIRGGRLDERWVRQCTLGFQDEGHHVLRDNKWGRALAIFPSSCKWMLPTATPDRADGRGLGRKAEGCVDRLILGPDMRWMIDNGYLTDYELRAPHPRDFDMSGVAISPVTGEYNLDQMRQRVKESKTIIGDVVKTYLKYAPGKRGITFAVDIEHAKWIADAFNKAGVPALVVSSETTDADRREAMKKLVRGELLQLVNVDLFGEGVDVPVLEVVIFARPTASYPLYCQQFGRVLRLMLPRVLQAAWDTFTVEQRKAHIAASGKPRGIVLDLVGNIITHGGPPDRRREPWTLESRQKRTRATDTIPMRTCLNEECLQPYERVYPACPYCGAEPPLPAERSKPEHVDGDVVLYDQALLDKLFGEVAKIDDPHCAIPYGASDVVARAVINNHRKRKHSQNELRRTMQLVMPPSRDSRINDRKFFLTYGIDTLTAKTLGSADADTLRQRILEKVNKTC